MRKADQDSAAAQTALVTALETNVPKFATEDANLVAFGSLARREWVELESDLDWTYFIDGQAKSVHLKIAQQIRAAVELETVSVGGKSIRKFGEPGPTGTFGNLAYSHQLVHLIGGQDDTVKIVHRKPWTSVNPLGRPPEIWLEFLGSCLRRPFALI